MNPYDLVFAHPSIEAGRFRDVAEDLELRGSEATDPDAFGLLDPVRALVAALGTDEPGGPRGEEYRALARLVYHGFLYWRAGKPARALDRDAAKGLAVSGDVGDTPGAAGWVALPSTLFWARVRPSAPPEPVNGFFWAAPDGELQVQLVTGMRPDRPGFGTLDARAAFGPDGFAEEFSPRPDGAEPFANILPGGELDGLLAVVTPGEALTLAARALARLAAADRDGA